MTHLVPNPIPESYWVIPGKFLAGEYPGRFYVEQTRRRIDDFLMAGFNTFIDLTIPDELSPYAPILLEQAAYFDMHVVHQRFPIGDYGLPTQSTMRSILNAIDNALSNGNRVYLHCWGGIGRTGTTVGCYLVRHGLTGPQALAQLSTWWRTVPKSMRYPHSPETQDQVNFILNWHDE